MGFRLVATGVTAVGLAAGLFLWAAWRIEPLMGFMLIGVGGAWLAVCTVYVVEDVTEEDESDE